MNTKSGFLPQSLRRVSIFLGGVVLAVLCNLFWPHSAFAQSAATASYTPSHNPDTIQSVFPVAGLTLQLEKFQQQPDGSLHADTAKLTLPDQLGGASATLNDVTVKDGVVSVGAGKFDLPTINVAGLTMQLTGEFSKGDNNAQIITAGGIFKVQSMGEAAGCKGLTVSVTLAATALNGAAAATLVINSGPQAVLSVGAPYLAEELMNVALRHASLTLDCSIPIGQSGFALKSVTGAVTLTPQNDTVTVAVEVEVGTVREVLGKTLVSAKGKIELTPSPFRLALESGVKVFDTFDVAKASAEIMDQRFSGTIEIKLLAVHGAVSIDSWIDPKGDPKNFHFRGSGTAELKLAKGAIYRSCKKFIFIKFGCIRMPPSNINIGKVEVQAGEFRDGDWGFKGAFDVNLKLTTKQFGFYIDTGGTVKFGKVEQYNLLTPPQVTAAFANWQRVVTADGTIAAAQINPGLHFGSTASAFPLTYITTIANPSELLFTAVRQGENPKLTLVAPDGTEITPDALPENVGYSEDLSTPEESDEIPVTQMTYYIDNAAPGDWQAVLTGEPGADEYYSSEVFGHVSEPTVQTEGSTVRASSDHTDATITWQLTAYNPDTLVSIYANPGPISETLVISDENGLPTTVAIASYEGIRLAEGVPTSEDNTPQSHPVNVDELPSGSYRVWLEVDDQINDPVQVYLDEPLVVDHSSEWTPTWSPVLTLTEGYEEITLQWSDHPTPDVDEYIVYVSETPGSANPEAADDSFFVGSEEDVDLSGLEGDTTLYVAIGAYDDADIAGNDVQSADAEHLVLSPEVKVETKAVEFSLIPAATTLKLGVNQSANLSLTLTSPVSPFPDPIYLYDNCQPASGNANTLYLPLISRAGGGVTTSAQSQAAQPCLESDGFAVSFDPDNVIPTAEGVSVTMTIKAVNTKPGVYTIPIIGESNNTEQTFMLEVTVTAVAQ